MTRMRSPRGFTLIELLTALGVSAIVIAAGLALLVAQQRSFQAGTSDRALQETARIALEHITSNLRMAGYGVDPALAFDFGDQPDIMMRRAPPIPPKAAGTTVVKYTSPSCDGGDLACRDSVTVSDQIAFWYRDPAFGHALSAGYVKDSRKITLTGPLQAPLYKGQVLQVLCHSGNMFAAYVQVAKAIVKTDDLAKDAVDVDIAPLSGSSPDFPSQADLLQNDECFTHAAPKGATAFSVTMAAKVYKVGWYRYFVGWFDASGKAAKSEDAGSRPYLMLDQGLWDENDKAIVTMIAPDVEDLQFAYVYPRSTGALQVVGATQDAAISADDVVLDPGRNGIPAYGDPPDATWRANQHPANIRAVRVSIVVRSPTRDDRIPDATVPAAGNRKDVAGEQGYRRLLVETSTATRNLDALEPNYPAWGAVSDQLNVGGG